MRRHGAILVPIAVPRLSGLTHYHPAPAYCTSIQYPVRRVPRLTHPSSTTPTATVLNARAAKARCPATARDIHTQEIQIIASPPQRKRPFFCCKAPGPHPPRRRDLSFNFTLRHACPPPRFQASQHTIIEPATRTVFHRPPQAFRHAIRIAASHAFRRDFRHACRRHRHAFAPPSRLRVRGTPPSVRACPPALRLRARSSIVRLAPSSRVAVPARPCPCARVALW